MIKTGYADHGPMQWNSEYSVELPALDSQHKELISFFNAAVDHCCDDRTEERKYFDTVIDVFIGFLDLHFRTEEQFLSGKEYALSDKHKLDHSKLLEKINLIKDEIQRDKMEINLFALTTSLKDWLMYHFNTYDINAREYFGEKQPA